MKHTHIAAALGWSETPDNQEGLFLQPEEAATIDAALGKNADNTKAAEDLAAANERIKTLESEAATAKTTADTQAARITELEAENEKLGAESSGSGTTLPTGGDENAKEGTEKKVGLSDPNHPLNQLATRRVNAARAKK